MFWMFFAISNSWCHNIYTCHRVPFLLRCSEVLERGGGSGRPWIQQTSMVHHKHCQGRPSNSKLQARSSLVFQDLNVKIQAKVRWSLIQNSSSSWNSWKFIWIKESYSIPSVKLQFPCLPSSEIKTGGRPEALLDSLLQMAWQYHQTPWCPVLWSFIIFKS